MFSIKTFSKLIDSSIKNIVKVDYVNQNCLRYQKFQLGRKSRNEGFDGKTTERLSAQFCEDSPYLKFFYRLVFYRFQNFRNGKIALFSSFIFIYKNFNLASDSGRTGLLEHVCCNCKKTTARLSTQFCEDSPYLKFFLSKVF